MAQSASPDQPIERDPSEEVADWLQDMGRRGVRSGRQESDEALRVHFEQIAERRIRTRKDINDYVKELTEKVREKRSKSNHLKNAVLAALFVVALLQYYFIDVQLEILTQPAVTVFVPSIDLASPLAKRI